MKNFKKVLSVFLVFLLVTSLTACKSTQTTTSAIKDGTYTETGVGIHGDVSVEVVVKDAKIASVVVKEHSETKTVPQPTLIFLPRSASPT